VKQIIYIFIFFVYSSLSYADDNQQKQINNLFNQLKTTTNYENSKKIESKIWELWSTHPSKNNLTALLADGSFYVSQNKLEAAYETFTKAIELDPEYGDAYCNRGIAKEKAGLPYCSDYKKACELGYEDACGYYNQDCR